MTDNTQKVSESLLLLILTFPALRISESLKKHSESIKTKVDLNFPSGVSKGFTKAIEPSEAPKRSMKIKILIFSLPLGLGWQGLHALGENINEIQKTMYILVKSITKPVSGVLIRINFSQGRFIGIIYNLLWGDNLNDSYNNN